MRRLLASVRFALVAAGQNFTRNFAVSMAGGFAMGLIILLVGGALLLTHTVDSMLGQQEGQADEIHIWLQDSLSMRTVADYEQRFARDPRVNGVSFTSKDQAVVEEQKRGFQLQNVITALQGSNPLPASIDLHVKTLADLGQFNSLAAGLPIVDTSVGKPTDYSPDVIPRLQSVIFWTDTVGGVLSALLAIMNLVGASDWFVRWPFILEGVFGGILAAAFGATVVGLAYHLVLSQANASVYLGIPYDGAFLTGLVVALVGVGAALGGVGSFLGVRRFLHV